MKSISIGGRLVGKDAPTYVIAEMSGNHGGQLAKALEIVREAKQCGADAVKLQTYTPDTITLNSNKPDFRIPSTNPWNDHGTLYDLYEKAHTPWDWHAPLFAEAKKVGIQIFSSPFDGTAVDLLEKFGAPAYKIASPEITDVNLLRKVARTGKPVILSTGVAELADIDLAVRILRENGCDQIVILKCTSSYPSQPETINLRTMVQMGKTFDCLVGFSDHTVGMGAPIAAVALGASVIEKHFILDRCDESVDGFFSMDRHQFKVMIDEIHAAQKSLGRVDFQLDEEGKRNAWGRRSLYVCAPISEGEIFTAKNVKSVRPSFGLHPRYWDVVIGKRSKRDLELGDRLSLADVDLQETS